MPSYFERIARQIPTRRNRIERRMHKISRHMVWHDQPWFLSAKKKYGEAIAGIPEIRCFFLQSAIRSLSELDGAVAECGSRNGKSALYMLEACETERDFFLFDSFEGLSDPVPGKDTLESAMSEDGNTRLFQTDFSAVQRRFEPFGNVHIKQGWIPDRFAEVKDHKFCLLHVDVDLHQPTLDSLVFFYDRLVHGGMIICDDYGSANYPGARLALDEFFADKPEKPVELPQGQAFIVKR